MEKGGVMGGVQEAPEVKNNSLQVEELGRYAVDEHNKQANALLEFKSVVNVKEQVVSGTIYYLTIEVVDSGEKKLYEAKVWVKPWMDFKQLQQFKLIGSNSDVADATVTASAATAEE